MAADIHKTSAFAHFSANCCASKGREAGLRVLVGFPSVKVAKDMSFSIDPSFKDTVLTPNGKQNQTGIAENTLPKDRPPPGLVGPTSYAYQDSSAEAGCPQALAFGNGTFSGILEKLDLICQKFDATLPPAPVDAPTTGESTAAYVPAAEGLGAIATKAAVIDASTLEPPAAAMPTLKADFEAFPS